MFFKYLEFLIAPFRKARSAAMKARNVKGRVQMDVNRAKSLKNQAKQNINKAKKMGAQAKQAGQKAQQGVQSAREGAQNAQQRVAGVGGGGAQGAGTQAQGAGGAQPAQGGHPGAAPGQAGGAPAASASGGAVIEKKGMCCWKKYFCGQCGEEMEKTWDMCPFCAQSGAEVPATASPASKTRAFMIDAAGSGSQMQLLGWVVPLKGPQRGELYTLAPVSIVGTDPSCTVCLSDGYMSSHHAEIKAEAGVWILRDLGSTNGTYVNDKRVDQHELVDNDFVQFGQSLVKFKTI